MDKYVLCISNEKFQDWGEDLTVNKIYKLVGITTTGAYELEDDMGRLRGYSQFRFKLLSPLEHQLYLAKERLKTNG